MKKGQITIFIILGIVLIMVFGFIYYISSSSQKTTAESGKEQAIRNFLEATSLKHYVENCLDKTLKEAVVLVGLQGGRIYDYQADGASQFKYDKDRWPYGRYILFYEGNNTSYGIYAPEINTDYGHFAPPEYPYSGQLVTDPIVKNVFGNFAYPGAIDRISNLPPLCDRSGSNAYSQEGAEYSCETYDSSSASYSVQEYIQSYIEQHIKSCADFQNLAEETNFQGFNIKEGDARATVLFGTEEVIAAINYSLSVTIGNEVPKLELLHFQVKAPVRLKQMHELASHMIEEDVKNIFFNFTNNATDLYTCPSPTGEKLQCLKYGMTVEQVRNPCKDKFYLGTTDDLCPEGIYDDIIKIIDTNATIDGQPYIFQFAVDNRIPALNYAEDIEVDAGETIILSPTAIDPDGDEITYTYSGWKTDIPVDFNSGTEGGGSTNEWQSSHYYTAGYNGGQIGKDASYPTTTDDVGDHHVRITAKDEDGRSDYQDIIITVNP